MPPPFQTNLPAQHMRYDYSSRESQPLHQTARNPPDSYSSPDRSSDNRRALSQGGSGMRNSLLSLIAQNAEARASGPITPKMAGRYNQFIGRQLLKAFPRRFHQLDVPASMRPLHPSRPLQTTYQQQPQHYVYATNAHPGFGAGKPYGYPALQADPHFHGRPQQQYRPPGHHLPHSVAVGAMAGAAGGVLAYETTEEMHPSHWIPNPGGGSSLNGLGYGQMGDALNGVDLGSGGDAIASTGAAVLEAGANAGGDVLSAIGDVLGGILGGLGG